MRKVLYAALVACVFTFVPISILKLESETPFVNSLNNLAVALGLPGFVVGLIAAFGRVHDVDLWVTDISNFAFYFTIPWLLLKWRSKTHETDNPHT